MLEKVDEENSKKSLEPDVAKTNREKVNSVLEAIHFDPVSATPVPPRGRGREGGHYREGQGVSCHRSEVRGHDSKVQCVRRGGHHAVAGHDLMVAAGTLPRVIAGTVGHRWRTFVFINAGRQALRHAAARHDEVVAAMSVDRLPRVSPLPCASTENRETVNSSQ